MDVKALLAEIGKLSPGDKLKVATAVESKPDTKTVSQVQLGNGSQARLSPFSGDDAKGDVSFELWKFEVRGMVRDGLFPNAVVLQSIRRSLRGTAADILLHLVEDVKVDDLLSKLEKVFGNTLPPEAILEEFYSAKQRESEKVAMWVCRLETILSKLPVGTFTPDASKGMLRTKFYSGLRLSVMRNALRHSFDGSSIRPTQSTPVVDDKVVSSFEDCLSRHLDQKQISEVKAVIQSYGDVFTQHDLDLGHVKDAVHRIRLTDDHPFKERPRRIPPQMIEEVRNHLQEMLDLGVIRRSHSSYSSNVVLVKKKNGSLRFCIDLRRLNTLTVRDAYALPRIDDTFDALSGAKYFSTLDLKSAYWQVELAEEDKEKTAFTVGQLGFFECNRMPFGLTNAPATFQRLLESCMGDLHLSTCLLYLDDIIIFSETYEQHLERLEAVFNRLREKGLKLSPSKCVLFQRSTKYLGHVISDEGVGHEELARTHYRSRASKSTRFRWILPKVHTSVF